MRQTLFTVLIVLITGVPALAAEAHGDAKVSRAVDAEITAALEKHKLKPAGPATDAEFVRRAYLDLLGRVPTAAEARAYLDDKAAGKHAGLIDKLLDHPEAAAYWAVVLHVWMNGRSADPGPGYGEFRAYLEKSFADNKRWDKLARELLLPGDDAATGPAAFFLGSRLGKGSKEDRLDGMTVAVASTLFGVRLECAKCHDHPYVPEWKQKHYYGLGAFLHRTERVSRGGRSTLGERGGAELTYRGPSGEALAAKMTFLDDKAFDDRKGAAPGHREVLADYALQASNPYFKRALVNRAWKQLLGVGLVEPVDQIHDGNKPTHPKLFALLADDFAASGFNVKRLLAVILHTEAYRRSSAWAGKGRPRDALYAAAALRPLTPEQLALSVATATGYEEVFKLRAKKGGAGGFRAEVEKDFRAFIEAYDSDADRFAATTAQALFLTFNKTTQKYLTPAGGNLVARLVKTADAGDLADQAFLAVLSRPPTRDEKDEVAKYLKTPGVPRAQLCREVVWALLAGAEFRFNH